MIGRLWILQVLRAVAEGAACQGEKASLGDEEAIGRDAERGVVVKATPAAALVAAAPEFLLEFLIVTLDQPTPVGRGDQTLCCSGRMRGKET